MDRDIMDINLEECEGFCVGEYESSGCSVTYDSVVIFVGELDVSCQYSSGKKVMFELKAADSILNVEVECRLKNRDVRKKIITSSDWESYSIPLSEFGGDVSEWKFLKEIKFLLRRENTPGGKIEIRNMKI